MHGDFNYYVDLILSGQFIFVSHVETIYYRPGSVLSAAGASECQNFMGKSYWRQIPCGDLEKFTIERNPANRLIAATWLLEPAALAEAIFIGALESTTSSSSEIMFLELYAHTFSIDTSIAWPANLFFKAI